MKQTTLAALNIDYPKEKITICVCDDGNSAGAWTDGVSVCVCAAVCVLCLRLPQPPTTDP